MKKTNCKPAGVLLAFAMLCAAAFSACSKTDALKADDGKVYTIRMGCATVLPSHPNWFMEEFKKSIESKTDKIKVELYPANQLGSNTEMIQGLQNGTIQTVVLPIGFFTPTAPILNVLDLPRLVPNSQMQYEMLNDSDIGKVVVERVQEKGLLPLGFLWCVEKETILNRRVTTFEDLRGLKIRNFDSTVAQNEIRAYGATPVSMSTGDLAMALQQGAINGVLADVTMFAPLKLYEMAPNLVKAPFSPLSNVLMFSKQFVDDLPADLQTLLKETVTEVRIATREYTIEYIKQCYSQIQSGGGLITTPDAVFNAAIQRAAESVHQQLLKDQPDAKDLYDQVVKYVAAHQ